MPGLPLRALEIPCWVASFKDAWGAIRLQNDECFISLEPRTLWMRRRWFDMPRLCTKMTASAQHTRFKKVSLVRWWWVSFAFESVSLMIMTISRASDDATLICQIARFFIATPSRWNGRTMAHLSHLYFATSFPRQARIYVGFNIIYQPLRLTADAILIK